MALSNAVVPLLPSFAQAPSLQGAVYASYFFGAFALTLPAGVLADRFGKITVMRYGLFITVPSGILLSLSSDPVMLVAARLLEGAGAGLFVAAAMAYVNSLPDHEVLSGYYMASLNAGLVLGLVISGLLAVHVRAVSGIALFTVACLVALILSLTISETFPFQMPHEDILVRGLVLKYRNLWFSAIVLIGITGVVTSLYPSFSPAGSDLDSIWIAAMSLSTIVTSLVISRMPMEPARVIRAGGLLMAAGVVVVFYSPAGFIIIGAAAGIVMIAQMDFLSIATHHQGAAMGLFSTTSYLGMGLLPFLAGILADHAGYAAAFFLFGATAVVAALIIGKPSRDDGEFPELQKR